MQRNNRRTVKEIVAFDASEDINHEFSGDVISEFNNQRRKAFNELEFSYIKAVGIGILSTEQIVGNNYANTDRRGISILEITSSELYGRNSVNDPRLGSTNPQMACEQCMTTDCNGHIGHIRLALPFINPNYEKQTIKLINSFCRSCGNLLLPASKRSSTMSLFDIEKACTDYLKTKQGECPFNGQRIRKDSKEVYKCETKTKYKIIKKKGEPPKIEKYSYKGNVFIGNCYPLEIKDYLSRIPHSSFKLVGLNSINSHPKNAIMEVIIVTPLPSRPSSRLGNTERVNPQSEIYANIVKYNNMLRIELDKTIPTEQEIELARSYVKRLEKNENIKISDVPGAIKERAQTLARTRRVNELYTVDLERKSENTRSYNRYTTKVNPFLQIYDNFMIFINGDPNNKNISNFNKSVSGKGGFIRNKNLGTQTNYCARTVIGPKRGGRVDVVQVPSVLRNALTKRMKVNALNIKYAISLLIQGEVVSVDREGVNYQANNADIKNIYIGDTIELKATSGDRCLFGRQPTLSENSLRGQEIEFIPEGEGVRNKRYTILYHQLITTPLNADNDGDEAHMSSIQTVEGQAENEFTNGVGVCNTTTDGTPVHVFITSFITWAYRLTNETSIVNETTFQMIIENLKNTDDLYDFYKRVDTLGLNRRSGRVLFSLVLPRTFNYTYGDITKSDYVQIINGILYRGTLTKKHLGGNVNGILIGILRGYGDRRYHDFLQDSTELLQMWGEEYPDTISLNDCSLEPKKLKNQFTDEDFYDITMFDAYRKFLIYSKIKSINGLEEVLNDIRPYSSLTEYPDVVKGINTLINDIREQVNEDEDRSPKDVEGVITREEIAKKIEEYKDRKSFSSDELITTFHDMVLNTPSIYTILKELDTPITALERKNYLLFLLDMSKLSPIEYPVNSIPFPDDFKFLPTDSVDLIREKYLKYNVKKTKETFYDRQTEILGEIKYFIRDGKLRVKPSEENTEFLKEVIDDALDKEEITDEEAEELRKDPLELKNDQYKRLRRLQNKYIDEIKINIPKSEFQPRELFKGDKYNRFRTIYQEDSGKDKVPKTIRIKRAVSMIKKQDELLSKRIYVFKPLDTLREEKEVLFDILTGIDIQLKLRNKYNNIYQSIADLYSLLNKKKHDALEDVKKYINDIYFYIDDFTEYYQIGRPAYYLELKKYVIDLILYNTHDKSLLGKAIDEIRDNIQSDIDKIFLKTDDKFISKYQDKLYSYAVKDLGNRINTEVKDAIKREKGALEQLTDVGGGGKGSHTHGVKIRMGGQVYLHGAPFKKVLTEGTRIFPTDEPGKLTPQMMSYLLTGYYEGLSPVDKIADSASSRTALADTNLTTPSIGDQQRKLTKNTENMKVNELGIIDNDGSYIYQILFGGHGYNPKDMYRDEDKSVPYNLRQIALNLNAKYGWVPGTEPIKSTTEDLPEISIPSVREKEINYLNTQIKMYQDLYDNANEYTKGLTDIQKVNYIGSLEGEISKLESQLDKIKLISINKAVPGLPPGKVTPNIATKFELASLIGFRAKQLENGYKPVGKTSKITSYEIARDEVLRKVAPVLLVRDIGGGNTESYTLPEIIFRHEITSQ